MTFEEIKQYNKLVIDTANDIAKGWKWATFILGGLLLAMIVLYFTCPANVTVSADTNDMKESVINQKG